MLTPVLAVYHTPESIYMQIWLKQRITHAATGIRLFANLAKPGESSEFPVSVLFPGSTRLKV